MNLLTVIILIIFALCIVKGYRKGFIKSLASIFSLVLSIVIVNLATPYVTEFLKTQTPVYKVILEKCEEMFPAEEQNPAAADRREKQDAIIDELALPGIIRDFLKENNTPEYYGKIMARSFSEYIQNCMAMLILNILSFIVTWVLVISFIGLIVMALDLVAKLPVLRGINQLLGLGLGFLQGLIIVWMIFLVITIFSQSDAGRELMRMILESPILCKLYDTNILLNFLQNTASKFI